MPFRPARLKPPYHLSPSPDYSTHPNIHAKTYLFIFRLNKIFQDSEIQKFSRFHEYSQRHDATNFCHSIISLFHHKNFCIILSFHIMSKFTVLGIISVLYFCSIRIKNINHCTYFIPSLTFLCLFYILFLDCKTLCTDNRELIQTRYISNDSQTMNERNEKIKLKIRTYRLSFMLLLLTYCYCYCWCSFWLNAFSDSLCRNHSWLAHGYWFHRVHRWFLRADPLTQVEVEFNSITVINPSFYHAP